MKQRYTMEYSNKKSFFFVISSICLLFDSVSLLYIYFCSVDPFFRRCSLLLLLIFYGLRAYLLVTLCFASIRIYELFQLLFLFIAEYGEVTWWRRSPLLCSFFSSFVVHCVNYENCYSFCLFSLLVTHTEQFIFCTLCAANKNFFELESSYLCILYMFTLYVRWHTQRNSRKNVILKLIKIWSSRLNTLTKKNLNFQLTKLDVRYIIKYFRCQKVKRWVPYSRIL